jgi:hypothetical protein
MNEIHLPRWDELPSIELYKEQVLELLDQSLKPLGLKPITASMINNYTKLGWIPAPVKKKYSRKHVAHIFVIAILKDVFELSEICNGIKLEKSRLGFDKAYDRFTQEIEDAVDLVSRSFLIEEGDKEESHSDSDTEIMKYTALSFAIQRHTRQLMNLTLTQGEKTHAN